jgi:hypothetical protein
MNIFSIIEPRTQREELKAVIGKETSQNFSPTCRAKLLKVNKVYSLFESVPSPYVKNPKPGSVGIKYKVPNSIAWNSFFY